MKNVIMGAVKHTTSCTRMGVKGWACRVYANGKLNQEKLVATRQEIGPAFHEMLRWECKCGNWSKMADRSRFRYWEKLDKLNAERKANMLAPTTTNKVMTYCIKRHYAPDVDKESKIILTGLTLEEAQAHCADESTHCDEFFDGYYKEDEE